MRSILERFTRYYDLSDDEQDALKGDIRQLSGEHEGYSALRDRFVDLENASGFFAPAEEPVGPEPVRSPFAASFEEFRAAGGAAGPAVVDPIFTRLRGQLIATRRETGDLNRAWVNDALTGDDLQQREFAALFLSEMGGAIPLQEVLSESAQANYLAHWNEQFALEDRVALGEDKPADSRLAAVARTASDIPSWVLPTEVIGDLLLEISRSPDATDRQRQALIDHIDRVVTPFDAGVGAHLRDAVLGLNVGMDENGKPNYGKVPARFTYLLSHEHLLAATRARGIVIPHPANGRPVPPPGLLDDADVTDNARGAALGAVGLGAAVVFGASPPGLLLAGAGGLASGLGLVGAIDDNDDAQTAYLIQKEFYDRYRDPDVNDGLIMFLNSSVPPAVSDDDSGETTKSHRFQQQ